MHRRNEMVTHRLMAAGCVAPEEEADELIAAAPDDTTLERLVRLKRASRRPGPPGCWVLRPHHPCRSRGRHPPPPERGLAHRAAGAAGYQRLGRRPLHRRRCHRRSPGGGGTDGHRGRRRPRPASCRLCPAQRRAVHRGRPRPAAAIERIQRCDGGGSLRSDGPAPAPSDRCTAVRTPPLARRRRRGSRSGPSDRHFGGPHTGAGRVAPDRAGGGNQDDALSPTPATSGFGVDRYLVRRGRGPPGPGRTGHWTRTLTQTPGLCSAQHRKDDRTSGTEARFVSAPGRS